MNQSFNKPHLNFVQWIWTSKVQTNATIIDATCGNGHDSLYLLKNVLNKGTGTLYALDIQKKALESSKQQIERSSLDDLVKKQFHPLLLGHEKIDEIPFKDPPDLIIYNLGYLPGFEKHITTVKETTLESLTKASLIINLNGIITITCYPGHQEGKIESEAIEAWLTFLNEKQFQILKLTWNNQPSAPYVIVLQKRALT